MIRSRDEKRERKLYEKGKGRRNGGGNGISGGKREIRNEGD